MLIADWITYFDVLQDRFGSPYFTDSEKMSLFNRAIVDFVNSHFPTGKKYVEDVEQNQRVVEDLNPLIFRVPAVRMDSAGIITANQVLLSLQALVPTAQVMRLLNVGWEQSNSYTVPVKFTRHNDWYQFKMNFFKDPKRGGGPRFYLSGLNYYLEPVNISTNIRFTVLKYPVVVNSTGVECDLPDFTHNELIARALELAGISSRDESLTQLLALQQKSFDSSRYEV